MTVAYLDCFCGVSGDMLLGALVGAGLDLADLQQEVDHLHVGARLRCESVVRCGIRATRVVVLVDGQPAGAQREHLLADGGPPPAHDHEVHPHGHTHLSDLLAVVEGSGLDDAVRATTCRVFRRLAEAEAEVHGVDPESVALHEVGGLDAIVDIAGTVAGLRRLGVTEVLSSPLYCGTGTATCAHGRYPVPVPGVLALCRGVPLVQTDVEAELVTPTGAALVTTLAQGYGRAPALRLGAVGYGAGSRDLTGRANVLRLRLGERVEAGTGERCVLVEANVDDMNPEVFSYLFDRLLQEGARDVYVTPVLMKKGRPGHLLSVLVDPAAMDAVCAAVLQETTSLGVRFHEVERRLLERSSASVQTPYGTVRVKVAHLDGRRRVAPEYEDCASLARRHGVPILTVYGAATAAVET